MSIDHIECDGASILSQLEQLRSQFPSTKRYPFIIGDDGELTRLLKHMQYHEKTTPTTIVVESLGFDILAWFAECKAEALADGFSVDDIVGEWNGEIQEKGSITSHVDTLTKAVKPVVYIGMASVEQPWMLPAELKYGGWNNCPHADIQCAVMRYWKEKHGAEIVSMTDDIVECIVQEPPRTVEESMRLAWEQYWYCSDIVEQGTQTIATLAAVLMNSSYWFFWWD